MYKQMDKTFFITSFTSLPSYPLSFQMTQCNQLPVRMIKLQSELHSPEQFWQHFASDLESILFHLSHDYVTLHARLFHYLMNLKLRLRDLPSTLALSLHALRFPIFLKVASLGYALLMFLTFPFAVGDGAKRERDEVRGWEVMEREKKRKERKNKGERENKKRIADYLTTISVDC